MWCARWSRRSVPCKSHGCAQRGCHRFEASNAGESTTTWMNFEPMAREILAKPGRNELWQAQDLPRCNYCKVPGFTESPLRSPCFWWINVAMWCKNLDLLLTPPWLAPHSWCFFLGGFSFVGGTSSHSDPTLIHTKNWIHVIQVARMLRCCQAVSVLSAAWSTWKASTFDAGAALEFLGGSTPGHFWGTRISPGKLMELWVIWWTTFGVKMHIGVNKKWPVHLHLIVSCKIL